MIFSFKICPLCDGTLTKFEFVNKNNFGFSCDKCFKNNGIYHLTMDSKENLIELVFVLDGYEVAINFNKNKTYIKNYDKFLHNDIILNINGIIDFDFSSLDRIKEKISGIFFAENFV